MSSPDSALARVESRLIRSNMIVTRFPGTTSLSGFISACKEEHRCQASALWCEGRPIQSHRGRMTEPSDSGGGNSATQPFFNISSPIRLRLIRGLRLGKGKGGEVRSKTQRGSQTRLDLRTMQPK